MENSKLLRLGLQFFAEDAPDNDEIDDAPEDDFDFSEEEENATLAEESEESEEPAVQGEEEQSPQNGGNAAEKYKVVYNGKELELSLEELTVNAQKGMNYDKVLGERDNLKAAKEFEVIERLAKSNGMTKEQFLDAIEKQAQEDALQAQIASGVPPEVARRLIALEQKTAEQERRETESVRQEQEKKQFADFVAVYPEVKELPAEVTADLEKGVPLVYAYAAYENKALKSKLSAMEKNQENERKGTGSMRGNAGFEHKDDFLSGFDSN